MKKFLSLILLAALLLLSACAVVGGPPAGTAQSPLDPAKPVTVTIWHYYNGGQQDAFNALADEFNESVGRTEGIIVEGRSFGNVSDLERSVLDAVEQKVGASSLPAVFAAYPDTAYAVDRLGYAVDIAPYLTDEERAAYVDSYLQEGSFSAPGTLKIFPVAKAVEVFLLNKTDWDKFAAATGATTDDFATVEGLTDTARRYYEWTDSLTPAPNDGRAFFGRDAMANFMFIGAQQLGVELISVENGTAQLNFDRDVLRRLWDNSYVPYVLGYYSSSGRFRSDDMKIGNIIACVGSSSGAGFYPDRVIVDDIDSYPIEMLVFPSPQFENAIPFAVQQGAGMVVTNTDEAVVYASVQFLKWFTAAERNIDFSLASGYLPVTKEANDFSRISQDVTDPGVLTLPILAAAVDTVNDNTLYTPPAFESGTAARNILEYSIPDLARADRDTVVARLEQGQSLEEAAAEFLTDAYFNAWYQNTLSQLEALVN